LSSFKQTVNAPLKTQASKDGQQLPNTDRKPEVYEHNQQQPQSIATRAAVSHRQTEPYICDSYRSNERNGSASSSIHPPSQPFIAESYTGSEQPCEKSERQQAEEYKESLKKTLVERQQRVQNCQPVNRDPIQQQRSQFHNDLLQQQQPIKHEGHQLTREPVRRSLPSPRQDVGQQPKSTQQNLAGAVQQRQEPAKQGHYFRSDLVQRQPVSTNVHPDMKLPVAQAPHLENVVRNQKVVPHRQPLKENQQTPPNPSLEPGRQSLQRQNPVQRGQQRPIRTAEGRLQQAVMQTNQQLNRTLIEKDDAKQSSESSFSRKDSYTGIKELYQERRRVDSSSSRNKDDSIYSKRPGSSERNKSALDRTDSILSKQSGNSEMKKSALEKDDSIYSKRSGSIRSKVSGSSEKKKPVLESDDDEKKKRIEKYVGSELNYPEKIFAEGKGNYIT